ncbi:hypothetical protein L1987_06527 [Smallanthus sonchifolius]|uniref:Uncharacterized protein n=1 Tax=Smallanthus sonchifolius TaxID=185202 RepID=A0ACB9JYE0_9ASTR|nr:hypothetical protein L1987_06527 [Smallanthus sonchifolius]
MVHEATEFVKKYLGGTQHDALIFCGSGTTAAIKRLQEVLGITIPSILKEKILNSTCIGIEERWVVFVGPYEHHSNLLSWRESLAQVIEIGLDEHGMIDIDDLKLRLEFYQGADDGYDAITLSPHKFLGGPGAPGILLMGKNLYQLKDAPPSTCRGGTVDYVNPFNEELWDTLYINDIEEREDAGTPQIIQRVKAALAFQVKAYIKSEVIKKKQHDYIERALERLVKHSNIWVLGNTQVERQAILSFLVYTTTYSNKRDKPLNGTFVAKLLNDLFGIQARGGCACAGPYGHLLLGIDEPHSLAIRSAVKMVRGYNGVKMGWTRVSFPYYMSNEEYESILAAIEFVAVYGQRFLPLYHLNWNTRSWTFRTNALEETFLKEKDCKLCASFCSTTHVPKANTQQKVMDCKIMIVSYVDIVRGIYEDLIFHIISKIQDH